MQNEHPRQAKNKHNSHAKNEHPEGGGGPEGVQRTMKMCYARNREGAHETLNKAVAIVLI